MPRLRVEPPQGAPFLHPLEGEAVVIGRTSDCDLVLTDRFLSRRHARIVPRDDGWLVEDLGSRNGTLLNGRRLAEPTPLKDGDEIALSAVRLRFEADGEEAGEGEPGLPEPGLPEGTIFRHASDYLQHPRTGSVTARTGAGEERVALEKYAGRLHIVYEVQRELAAAVELDELLHAVLDRVFEHLEPEEAVIFLRDEEGGRHRRVASRLAPGVEAGQPLSTTLIREVSEKGMAALVRDTQTDERFAEAASILSSGLRSLVAAPLLYPGGSLGLISLGSRLHVRRFSEGDMDLLTAVAAAAGLRIWSVELAAEAAERRRMQEEVALARRIQTALLPESVPELPGYRLHAGNLPSRGVSGDFYQVLESAGGCSVLVADVSGKGVAASLLTATLEALAAGPLRDELPPEEIFTRLSQLLYERTPPEKYATAFLGCLEAAPGRLCYASAGHNPCLVIRAAGGVESLGPTGLPLGLLATGTYRPAAVELAPGDTLLIYTDGITEAENPAGEEFGLARLEELCAAAGPLAPAALAGRLEAAVEEFAAGRPFADDRTLVILRRDD